MSDKEPILTLKVTVESGEIDVPVTARNSMLYTFLGKTTIGDLEIDNASVNHAFVQTGTDKEGHAQGMYFFKAFHPVFEQISSFMVENDFPMSLNQRSVSQGDLNAYLLLVDKTTAEFASQIPDTFPES